MLAAWIPEELHATLKTKLRRQRLSVREFLIYVATKYTGYQEPKGDTNGTPPPQSPA
jgi:hypothetical protein